MRQQIEPVTKRREEAYNKYDAAAWAAFYTLDAIDAVSFWSDGAAVGLPAILKRYEAEFASSPAQRCTRDRRASRMNANAAGPMRRTKNMRAIPAAVQPSEAPPKNVTEFLAAIATLSQ